MKDLNKHAVISGGVKRTSLTQNTNYMNFGSTRDKVANPKVDIINQSMNAEVNFNSSNTNGNTIKGKDTNFNKSMDGNFITLLNNKKVLQTSTQLQTQKKQLSKIQNTQQTKQLTKTTQTQI